MIKKRVKIAVKTIGYCCLLILTILFMSCQRSNNQIILKDNDTIKYFSDFDPFLNTPIGSMNNKPKKYPYCMVQYEKNTKKIKNIVFYYNDNRGLEKSTFIQKGNTLKKISVYNPEPYFCYSEQYSDSNRLVVYAYNCDSPCDVYNDNGGCDTLCWLTAIEISYKNKIYSYYFDKEDSIPKYKVPNIILKNNSIMKLKPLIGYNFETIIETSNEIISCNKSFCIDSETGLIEETFLAYNTDTCIQYRYKKDSLGSKNWVIFN